MRTRTSRSGKALLALAAPLLLVLGFVAGGYTVHRLDAGRHPHADAAAGEGDKKPGSVVARGRLEPTGGVCQLSVPMGDRLDRIVVKEGDGVKAGDELAYLASHPDRLADRNLAESQLEEARRRLKTVTAACEAGIREAEV